MSQEPDDLETPRELMRSVLSDAKHLQRRVSGSPKKSAEPGSPGWSRLWLLLRRLTERFYRQLDRKFQEGVQEPVDAEWQRRKKELQARGIRADALLHDLEIRQEQVNREWQTALGELDHLREDWSNLRSQLPPGTPGIQGVQLQEQLSRLERLWAEILQEDSTALREREAFSGTWRRLVGGLLPKLEKSGLPHEDPDKDLWLALAGKLKDLDKRWRGSAGNLRREIAQEEGMELSERLAQEEARSRQMSLRLLESLRRQQELESMFGADEADAQKRLTAQASMIENLEQDCRRMAKDLQKEVGQKDAASRYKELYKKALSRRRKAWKDSGKEAQKYLESVQNLNFELQSVKNEFALLQGSPKDVEFLQRSLERKMEELEAALQSRVSLQEQRDQAAREVAVVRLEKKKLVSELQELQASEQNLRLQRDRLTVERDTAKQGLDRAAEGLRAAKSMEQSLMMERERLVQDLGVSQRQLTDVQQHMSTLRSEMGALKEEMQKMAAEAAARERQAAAQAAAAISAAAAPKEPELEWSRIIEAILKPLSAASANLRRLAAGGLPEGHRTVVSMAYTSVGQVQDFVKMIDTFMDATDTPASPGNLQALVNGVIKSWEPAFRQRGASIVPRFDLGLEPVKFYQEPLRVAVYQVIRNAYEVISHGGCLTIRISRDKESKETTMAFSDTGPGFAPAVLSSLFTNSMKPRPGHLGLGLLLVRRIMTKVGGKVLVQNVPAGRGALISLVFPS